jgi:hypothetical protein
MFAAWRYTVNSQLLGIQASGALYSEQNFQTRFIFLWKYNETVHQLFVDFKKSYDSVRREVLYNILIQFGVPMKLVRLIKMCLNKT